MEGAGGEAYGMPSKRMPSSSDSPLMIIFVRSSSAVFTEPSSYESAAERTLGWATCLGIASGFSSSVE